MNQTSDFDDTDRGHVTGQVRQVLRGEALVILGASATLYFLLGGELWLFAVLFLAPDLSLVGYAAGRKVGAVLYNTIHSYALAAVLAVAGALTDREILWQVGLIFVAHAAFDRALGYGLKYAASFRHTHLGPIGKPAGEGH